MPAVFVIRIMTFCVYSVSRISRTELRPVAHQKHSVFVTGGTGFMGRRLIVTLLERGHAVKAIGRDGLRQRLPEGVEVVVGDALSPESIGQHVIAADTFVQLVGIAHPNPSKADEFRAIDQTAGFDRRMRRGRSRRALRSYALCLRQR